MGPREVVTNFELRENDLRVVEARHLLQAAEEAQKADPTNLQLQQASRSAATRLEEATAAAETTSLGKASGGGPLAP